MPIIAAIFMILAGFCAASMTAFVRLSSQELHTSEIAFFRNLLVLPIFLPILLNNDKSIFRTANIQLNIVRAFVGSGAMLLFFYGVSLTELAKVQALSFTIPIFATLLAIFFFNEKVRVRRWTAMLIGFAGAIIVLRPDITISLGPFAVLIACFLWSMSILIAKNLTKTDTNTSIIFWQAIGIIPASFIFSIPVWKWPNIYQFLLLAIIAILGTLAQLFLNSALRRGKISFILPLDYLKLIWAVILGYLIFDEIPYQSIWFGGTLIICATTYIGIRESLISKNKPNITP